VSAIILSLDDVTRRFDDTFAANNLSLEIYRGEFFTFLGPSGSGKSTVLRIIAGLEKPDSGRILIDGHDVAAVPPWNRNLGMVFQQYANFPHMSLAENVGYGLRVRKIPKAKIDDRVEQLLYLVGLAGREGQNITVLSGGEQQRVALARALALEPSLLLLDEPLAALDEKIRRDMQTELKHIQRETGTTFLYVTHDQEEALTMSDRIAVINHGECVQCDEPEALFRRPHTRFVASFFRGCNVLDAELLGGEAANARLQFGGGTVPATVSGAKAAGRERVGVAIRAENLRVGAGAESCPVRIEAVLNEMVYRGTSVDHLLELADGQRLVATSTRREADVAACRVTLGFKPEDVILLED